MSFGQTFRTAREAKGLTLQQVAAKTRILVQIITDMENEDFHRIPAPIYGRGFVKLFAECVDIDPTPLVHEFMEIYEGRRPPASAMPKPPAAPTPQPQMPPPPQPKAEPVAPVVQTAPLAAPRQEPSPFAATPMPVTPFVTPVAVETPPPVTPAFTPTAPFAEPIPEAVPEPVAPPPTEPAPVSTPQAEPLWDPTPTPPAPQPVQPEQVPQPAVVKGLDLFEQATAKTIPTAAPTRPTNGGPNALPPQIDVSSPYLSGSSYEDNGPSPVDRLRDGFMDISTSIIHRVHGIPRSAWRISLLVVASLLVLALIVFGCVKLYQATSRLPQAPGTDEPSRPAARPTTPPAATATKKAPAPTATKSQTKPTTATVPQNKPKVPGKLQSTGQKVPSLYID